MDTMKKDSAKAQGVVTAGEPAETRAAAANAKAISGIGGETAVSRAAASSEKALRGDGGELRRAMELYYDFWFGINALYEEWAKERGLTANALFALYFIQEYPDCCTMRLICDKLFLPKQTVSCILDSFEKKGYLTREVMASDKRNKLLRLTPEGQALANRLLSALGCFEDQALSRMTAGQRTALVDNSALFLDRLRAVLYEEKQNSAAKPDTETR